MFDIFYYHYLLYVFICSFIYYKFKSNSKNNIAKYVINFINNKVLIIGLGGSGKSTTSSIICNENNMKHIGLDKIVFGEGWSCRTYEEALSLLNLELDGKTKYIIEGAYIGTENDKTVRSSIIEYLIDNNIIEDIVVLDVSFPIRFYRILLRSIYRYLGIDNTSAHKEKIYNVIELLKKIYKNRNVARDALMNMLKLKNDKINRLLILK